MSGTLSIGEVLHTLEAEFPDITISKIRFLESQGLLNPERTPSGYRQFADADVNQLRWVLVQQRDNFLPLRVIKQRLESGDWQAAETNGTAGSPAPATTVSPMAAPASEDPVSENPATAVAPAADARVNGASKAETVRQPATPPPSPAVAVAPVSSPSRDPLDRGVGEVRMGVDELATAAGLEIADIRQLQKFGVVEPVQAEPAPIFDGDSLIIAKAAAAFMARGLEARHLKSWKLAADREADMLSQITQPLARSAGGAGQGEAVAITNELLAKGNDMREAMLRRALRPSLGLD